MALTDTAGELADRVAAIVESATVKQRVVLEEARKMANEAGIARARKLLADSILLIGNAQETRRAADERLRERRDDLAAALAEADWALDDRFETEGNRVWVLDELGVRVKTMTADERKTWKTAEALKQPAVAAASKAVVDAERNADAARDDLALAERRYSAAKHDLEAAIALLVTLRLSLETR